MPTASSAKVADVRRIVVIGPPGSGKSTLASQAARRLGCPHIEIDALFWAPGWVPRPMPELREEIARQTAGDCWVADGIYSRVRDILWPRAQTLVWIDLPLAVVWWRLLWRSLRRGITQKELWPGCQETLRDQFWSRESLFRAARRRLVRLRRTVPDLLREAPYAHLRLVRIRRLREAEDWLERLGGE